MTLCNELAFMEIDLEKKEVHGGDYTDQNNEPRCYNRTVRGIKKAALALQAAWTPETTMGQAITILCNNGLQMHRYCAMD